VLIREKC